jgi:hypothetical protein
MHDPQLTDRFLQVLSREGIALDRLLVFPTQNYAAYSMFDLLQFLHHRLQEKSDLIFLGFSAGVVAAIGAALAWQQNGGKVRALIALDGWGVPLLGDFPMYRLSHDEFTHWSSALLGTGEDSFYADPPVAHLDLWRSPDRVTGWAIQKNTRGETRSRTTAIVFLVTLLNRYF